MFNQVIPKKLEKGDEIRIISTSHSIATIDEKNIKLGLKSLEKLGLKVTFSDNCFELDEFGSSSVKSRVDDINQAFKDKNVKGILCSRGGFNSNQLLPYLDYKTIKKNPKVFCGYSDVTALNNGIFAKTGLVTYAGLNFSTFRKQQMKEYNIEYFKKCLMSNEPYYIEPSKQYYEYGIKKSIKNKGYFVINEGSCTGKTIGENLCTFNLLQGTKFMPDLKNKVLFIEEENISSQDTVYMFDRNLTSLCQQKNFDKLKGIVFGRVQKATGLTNEKLIKIIKSKQEIKDIPIIGGLDFAHTIPRFTYPIGGECELNANKKNPTIKILKH